MTNLVADAHNVAPELVAKMDAVANENGSGVWKADNIDALAKLVNADALVQSYTEYQAACETGVDALGKTADNLIAYNDDQGLYAMKVIPAMFGTLGGVLTDREFHVQLQDGSYVENLYAVGELATAGLYGEYYNGYSLTYYSTAGKIAGESAAASIK